MTLLAILVTATLLYTALKAILLNPIGHLSAAAREIGKGNLGAVVPYSSADELGHLAGAFREMLANMCHGAKVAIAEEYPDLKASENFLKLQEQLVETEDYLQFALMLANGGRLDDTRLLSRKSVDLLRTAFVPDSLPGRGPGEGYGLGVRSALKRLGA